MRLLVRIRKPSGEAASHVWWVLRRAAHAIEQNAVRSISALGLGLSEFAVLEVLLHKGPQPVNVIGKKVLLTSGSITAAVDRLESKKLVRRTADTGDPPRANRSTYRDGPTLDRAGFPATRDGHGGNHGGIEIQ